MVSRRKKQYEIKEAPIKSIKYAYQKIHEPSIIDIFSEDCNNI